MDYLQIIDQKFEFQNFQTQNIYKIQFFFKDFTTNIKKQSITEESIMRDIVLHEYIYDNQTRHNKFGRWLLDVPSG